MFKQRRCHLCFNRGIVRNKVTRRWDRCECGRLLDSKSEAKLSAQAKLDARAEEVRKGNW